MTVSLQFALTVDDDWPPVGRESMPFDFGDGGFKVLVPPLFVSNLSVDDLIEVEKDQKWLCYLMDA